MNLEVSKKGIVILKLIEKIHDLYHGTIEERIIICMDNKTILKNVVNIKMKLS